MQLIQALCKIYKNCEVLNILKTSFKRLTLSAFEEMMIRRSIGQFETFIEENAGLRIFKSTNLI